MMFARKSNNHSDIVVRKNGSSRVAGVDNGNGDRMYSEADRVSNAFRQRTLAQLPTILFIKEITNLLSAVQSNRRTVERILRNRNHYSVIRILQQCKQHR